MKHVSLILGLPIIVSAFLIFQWLDSYHLVTGVFAGLCLLTLAQIWKNRGQRSKKVNRIYINEGLGYLLYRGSLLAIGMLLYFSLFFWVISKTPIYDIFYPCDKVLKKINFVLESKAWPLALKEIDRCLRERLPLDCKKCIAQKKSYLLMEWADELEPRARAERLTDALHVAQKFDLKMESELAEAKKCATEFEINPKKLRPGCQGVIHQIETSMYPLVIFYFSIEDINGNSISDLMPKDIEVRENSELITDFQLSNFHSVPEPLNVALCIDRSGSMKEVLINAKQGAMSFVNALSTNDFVELIAFNENTERLLGWTEDKTSLISLLEGIEAAGNTAIYDALSLALEDFKRQNGKKAIVLLTDGKDTKSKGSLEETLEKASKMGIPVFVIGIKSPELDRKVLKKIAMETGGLYLEASNPSELTQLYKEIAGRLKNLYRLVYQSKSRNEKENKFTIAVGAEKTILMAKIYSPMR